MLLYNRKCSGKTVWYDWKLVFFYSDATILQYNTQVRYYVLFTEPTIQLEEGCIYVFSPFIYREHIHQKTDDRK